MRGAEDRPWGGDGREVEWVMRKSWMERGEGRGGRLLMRGKGGGGGIGDVVWQEGVFLGVVDMLGMARRARKCLQQTPRIFHGLAGNASPLLRSLHFFSLPKIAITKRAHSLQAKHWNRNR